MDKEAVVHIHKRISHSQKSNVFESVVVRWRSLELVIQNEVRKRKASIIY